MKMGKKGFTLIELIVVVIVIGILATIAIPQYLKATEKAKGGKARNAMGLIAQAEKLYRADSDTYIASGTGSFAGDFEDYVELNEVDGDTDWTYAVTGDASTFIITATRSSGAYASSTMTLNESGAWASDQQLWIGKSQ